MHLDISSVNRYSTELNDHDDYNSMNIKFKKSSNHNNSSTKSKDSKKFDVYVQHLRNSSNKKGR
jgi:hypothetical protein